MNKTQVFSILKLITTYSSSDLDLNWRLDGSTNLFVQGIDIPVNDIDIACDKKSLIMFKDVFSKYVNKYGYRQDIQSHSLLLLINNIEVEINNYDDPNLLLLDKVKELVWQDMTINILPLEFALEFYKLIGRQKKVDLIKKHIANS